jgi:DNA mismatch endonuclease (patch repair protein)
LPGKPDLVFVSKRKVIFVHGCFWHHHSESACKDGHMPKSNLQYWNRKLRRNVERDAESIRRLKDLGWDVLIIWECEIKNGSNIASRIKTFLR